MRAVVCWKPGELALEERPAPKPGEAEVLVRVRRVGICGTDYHIFEGKHPFLEYPRIMGHELAVEVIEAPAGSRLSAGEVCVVNPYLSCGHCIACRAGKPNCCVGISVLGVHRDGGMVGQMSLPEKNLFVAPGLTADECATVEFLAIGAHAVRRGAVTGRDRILVVGAGPIGLGVALFARLSGAAVAVFDKDVERANSARSILAVDTIAADGDPGEAVSAFTGSEGFDIVFDATGNRLAMEKGFDYVAHGGRYVLVSVIKDRVTFADPDFHRKEMTLMGSRNATSEDFERVIGAIRGGDVPIEDLITHRTGLADAVGNIPLWATEKTGLIKALIEIDE
ncbi:zinc-binding alcohol dehydrogenase family protein [Mesorhizobium sp. BAC0120]|uniref:zinc-binding alcohol dehydrogenase family protein n=1 Tax=Mesorhizobium sp. BAC0120 TaxID=3090670 RepID=UPI00298BE61A|nr:zinc-binding alcohol dehydrogenase family protein [Mesorhizobium sp. BAC0120]MDW6026313.1 zinc-binding alcohol dehydrogenase family protein [Mesorhizobium sp. BAC0120]